MLQRIRYAVLAAAGVAWAVANVLLGVLDNSYVTYPRVADADVGRVIPYEAKGIIVYITSDQRLTLRWLNWVEAGSVPLILVSLVLNQKWPLHQRR
jgi:hypothetical protein